MHHDQGSSGKIKRQTSEAQCANSANAKQV